MTRISPTLNEPQAEQILSGLISQVYEAYENDDDDLANELVENALQDINESDCPILFSSDAYQRVPLEYKHVLFTYIFRASLEPFIVANIADTLTRWGSIQILGIPAEDSKMGDGGEIILLGFGDGTMAAFYPEGGDDWLASKKIDPEVLGLVQKVLDKDHLLGHKDKDFINAFLIQCDNFDPTRQFEMLLVPPRLTP